MNEKTKKYLIIAAATIISVIIIIIIIVAQVTASSSTTILQNDSEEINICSDSNVLKYGDFVQIKSLYNNDYLNLCTVLDDNTYNCSNNTSGSYNSSDYNQLSNQDAVTVSLGSPSDGFIIGSPDGKTGNVQYGDNVYLAWRKQSTSTISGFLDVCGSNTCDTDSKYGVSGALTYKRKINDSIGEFSGIFTIESKNNCTGYVAYNSDVLIKSLYDVGSYLNICNTSENTQCTEASGNVIASNENIINTLTSTWQFEIDEDSLVLNSSYNFDTPITTLLLNSDFPEDFYGTIYRYRTSSSFENITGGDLVVCTPLMTFGNGWQINSDECATEPSNKRLTCPEGKYHLETEATYTIDGEKIYDSAEYCVNDLQNFDILSSDITNAVSYIGLL